MSQAPGGGLNLDRALCTDGKKNATADSLGGLGRWAAVWMVTTSWTTEPQNLQGVVFEMMLSLFAHNTDRLGPVASCYDHL